MRIETKFMTLVIYSTNTKLDLFCYDSRFSVTQKAKKLKLIFKNKYVYESIQE